MSDKRSAASLLADEPIRKADQDQLARARLVEVIGHHIVETSGPESVVLALNAPWGAGKSSFLNLLEQRLVPDDAPDPDRVPIVIRFNPWNYASVDQLVRMFFVELARGIGTARKKEVGKAIGTLLKAAGSLASIFSSGVGGALKDAGSALDSDKGLPDLKRELDVLLPDLAQRVVVFVDDLDRLERDTLRLLFRMIRLNADFPNVTYVLAFDRLVVEKNLDEPNGIRGRDYLEKIIQVSFDIPAPETSTMHHILFGEMHAVLDSIETRPLDQHRWGNVFHSGFKEQFRTIRHIKRYVNGLRLTLPPVAMEVDLVDFLAIELLRVFHPELYVAVARGKDMLTPSPAARYSPIPQERLRQWVDELCALAPGYEKAIADLLRRLFPQLERAYRNVGFHDGFYPKWRKECRVCSPEVFDKFFLLSIPKGDVSEIELASFVDGLSDRAATIATLQEFKEADRARRLLERLEDYTDEIPLERVPDLVVAMFDQGDALRFESRGPMDVMGDMQVARIIYQCLMRLTEPERHQLLLDCATSARALGTVVHEASMAEPTEREGDKVITERAAWETIRDAALARIEAANVSGDLWKLERLQSVLFRWREWTSEAHVQAAVTARIATDEAFLDFIAAFIDSGYSHAMGDKVGKKQVQIRKKSVAYFMSPDVAAQRLATIAGMEGDLGEYATNLIKLFGQGDRFFHED